MTLKISLVHYLNAAPLGWYFLHGPDRRLFDVSPDTPARCAERLAAGEVDFGLIPSIEYQRIPDLAVVPRVAIAATHEVRSVLLLRKQHAPPIATVALDTSSRTSVALVRLLLENRMRLSPTYVPQAPRIEEMLHHCDAALLIGDAALRCSVEEYEVLDLAAAWREWQEKPFVFAFWACRGGSRRGDSFADLFFEAKEWGLARIEEIAADYARRLQLPTAFLEQYLRWNLDHNLGPEHVDGLNQFYQLAFNSGLTGSYQPLHLTAG